jgi:hypothetical protein
MLSLGLCSQRVSYVSFITVVEEYFNYVWFFGLLQEPSRSRSPRILHIPTPDYSGVKPNVGCWRKDWKIGGESCEVSCAVNCSVIQI